ncbi:hypothetical protein [Ferrovibrio sp.]|uniref:hypothetical protein n=1 Tax=Ferrovibrio sp. TaxID=1917215 RepID=UPI0035B1775C
MSFLKRWFLPADAKDNVCPFPPPYRGMVAINSDVECTSWEGQLAWFELLAQRDLETAFSFWLFSSPALAWRLFEEDGRFASCAPTALHLIRQGLLDTVHSYGDAHHAGGARIDRKRIAEALRILASEGAKAPVYTNHGGEQDKQNIGGDWATYQEGDIPGAALYHLDIAHDYGFQFFWTDIDYHNDIRAFRPDIAGAGALFTPQQCRDGSHILRFKRYRGPLSYAPTATNLAEQVAPVLDTPPEGHLVIYQHLGCHRQPDGKPVMAQKPWLDAEGVAALDRMAQQQRDGLYIVTTTAKLLRHAAMMAARPWRIVRMEESVVVEFETEIALGPVRLPLDWDWLAGWTLHLKQPVDVSLRLGNKTRKVVPFTSNGKLYAGIPWTRIDMGREVEEAMSLG